MKNNRLHTILYILVLCCYFSALTPVHFLFHSDSEKEYHHCNTHSDSDKNKTTCFFCDTITSGQNIPLFEVCEFDFSTITISLKTEKTFFQTDFFYLLDKAYFLLRAPPVF